MNGSSWTDEMIATLRTLWDDDVPASEIGKRLGKSKSSCIGKAWRLKLTPRLSPIPPAKPKAPTVRVALPEVPSISCPTKARLMGGR